MQKSNRTDRILIAIALAIFFLASGLFYFDDWMWGNRRNRGERIGVLSIKTGDVRVKFEGEIKWQKAARGQDLEFNDSIYSGSSSEAKLQLGESEMTVSENTLVVLRREEQVNFLNLSFGRLFAKMAKNEKVIVETGNGKRMTLTSHRPSRFVIQRKGNRTEVEVVSGEVESKVDGKTTQLNRSSRLVVEAKVPALVEEVKLQLIQPFGGDAVYAEQPVHLDFKWAWSNGRKPLSSEAFTLEFATSPSFTPLHFSRQVKGELGTTINASNSLSLFYRVRGPRGEVSPIEKLVFVRLRPPSINQPLMGRKFIVEEHKNAMVDIEFRNPEAENSTIFYQLANDPEFKTLVNEDHVDGNKAVRELPVGNYYLRAKADYAENHATGWTPVSTFSVELKVVPLALPQAPSLSKILIPNRDYPFLLYSASALQVRGFLAHQGLLRDFFASAASDVDQLNLQIEDGGKDVQMFSQSDPAWPKDVLQPGHYTYKFQVIKKGFQNSLWSEAHRLEISMEPPRPVGEVQYGTTENEGASEAQWSFTPILFAKSYDVVLSKDPSMLQPREFNVTTNEVKINVQGQNFWKVRARDRYGRIISAYSPTYKLAERVPVYLARNEARRKPATEKSTTETQIEPVREEPFVKNGWWAWLGAGDNYVDYKQSIQGRGTLDDYHVKGPSEYFETGYTGREGWGGVVSYKHTPGEVNPGNAPIDNSSYAWTTLAIEGILRQVSSFTLFGKPVTYGVRAGVQQHRMPFVFLNSDANLELKANEMTNASLGVQTEWSSRRWTYYWMMRYQYPLASKADGATQFTIDPVFAFDGSVGTSYNITRQLKAGLFWYGQWHQFNFVYSDPNVTNSGFQALFYSNVDLRLGFDF